MPKLKSVSALAALAVILAPTLGFAADQPATSQDAAPGGTVTTASGLQIIDTKVGAGAAAGPGQICAMHYTGWLYADGAKGKKCDSSLDHGKPFEFTLGMHEVIKGWDEGSRA